MSTADQNVACIVIDMPGVNATVVLRGADVPPNPPSNADALALLQRVLDHARGQPAAQQQPADPVDEIRERAQRETAALTEQYRCDMANVELIRSLGTGQQSG